MKRHIRVEITGPLDRLLESWERFRSVEYNEQAADKATLIFHDEKTALFEDLKTVVKQIAGLNMTHIRYWAHNFTIEELQSSPLLQLLSTPREGLGFTRNYRSYKEIQRERILPVFTQAPLNGVIVQMPTEGWLFHSELISQLNREGLDRGLFIKPVVLENQPRDNWFWVHSKTNLGQPVIENRFINAFHVHRYLGEDFCTAELEGPPPLIVSQPVYRLLSELPPDKICAQSRSPFEALCLSFIPYDLI